MDANTNGSAPAESAAPAYLQQQVRYLADRRRLVAHLEAQLAERRRAFDEANRDLVTALDQAKLERGRVETETRELALAAFRATGDLHPAPGVSIRMLTQLEYDEVVALAWARETRLALIPEQLDRKALEKIARATPLPFVQLTQVPQPTLATDLDQALGIAAVTASAPAAQEVAS